MRVQTWNREEAPILDGQSNSNIVEIVRVLAAQTLSCPDELKPLGFEDISVPLMILQESASKLGPRINRIGWRPHFEPAEKDEFYYLGLN